MLALDSNVLSAVFRREASSILIVDVLHTLRNDGLILHISAYGEVLAGPGIQRVTLDNFIEEASISVDWNTSKGIWEKAIAGFALYAQRRRKSGGGQPRRILADFLIGAHATDRAGNLLTLDPQHYRQNFAGLNVIDPSEYQ